MSPRGRATATGDGFVVGVREGAKRHAGSVVQLHLDTGTAAAPSPGPRVAGLLPFRLTPSRRGKKGRKERPSCPACGLPPIQPISRPVHLPVCCIVPLTAKSGHYDLITPANADTTSRRTPGAARRINSRLLSRGTSAGEIKIDPRIIIITLAS